MAKMRQGIFGALKGKIGNLIGSSWKGIAYLKTKPVSVANPRTAKQIAQRSNMSMLVFVAQLLLSPVIKPLWDRFSVKMSGFNSFVRHNMVRFVEGVFTDFANFAISIGKMESTKFTASTTSDGANTSVTATWVNDSGNGFKLASDLSYLVVYNENRDEWFVSDANSVRSSGSNTFVLGKILSSGFILHVYLAFKRIDGTIVSMTSYDTIF